MNVTFLFDLSTDGQKASILAGGNGKREQTLSVASTDPEFSRAIAAATINPDGTACVKADAHYGNYPAPYWDHIPTATEILNDIEDRKAHEAADKVARSECIRGNTLAVLVERKTAAKGSYDHYAVQLAPDWPTPSDEGVRNSPEAVAWVAELEIANAIAVEEYNAKKAAEAAAKEAAAKEAAEKEAARRAALGMVDGDIDLSIEDGALVKVPSGMWSTHRRSKNWMATIDINPSSPGGLDRTFAEKAKGESYYILPSLEPGDAIEFGSDHYSCSGRRSPYRWYGFVVRIVPETTDNYGALILRRADNGKAAVKKGREFAASMVTA